MTDEACLKPQALDESDDRSDLRTVIRKVDQPCGGDCEAYKLL
jgi:hypothetical protein